jgi:hypothetical protein
MEPVKLTLDSHPSTRKTNRSEITLTPGQGRVAGKGGGQQHDSKASVKTGATLYIALHKKAILVNGETQKVKDTLKALNGSWNKFLSGDSGSPGCECFH